MNGILQAIGLIVVGFFCFMYFGYSQLPGNISEKCGDRGYGYLYCECVGEIAAKQYSFIEFIQAELEEGGTSFSLRRSSYEQCEPLWKD